MKEKTEWKTFPNWIDYGSQDITEDIGPCIVEDNIVAFPVQDLDVRWVNCFGKEIAKEQVGLNSSSKILGD